MILLVDIGNSRVKWSLWQDGAHARTGAFAYEEHVFGRTLDFEWRGLAVPEHIVVANVAGQKIADALYLWVQGRWKVHTEFTKAQKQAHGVTNSYARADRLGVDRWLAMVAARRLAPGEAVCVVDCGTALTADVVDAAGNHLGGLIVPGMSAMCEALGRVTAGVGAVHQHLPPPELALANDTQNAVLAGARLAAAGFIDRVIGDARARLATPVAGIITGGDAAAIIPLLRSGFRHESLLVLDGLAIVAGGKA